MIRFSIRRPVAVSMAYLAAAILGFAAWRNIPVEFLPNTELPRLSVNASWPGASPEATEAFVTAPLEGAIQQVRGVQKINSVSSELGGAGQARIDVELARGTDMNFARLELSERMASLDDVLPPNVVPTITPYTPPELRERDRPFLEYTLTGPYIVEHLRVLADEHLVPALQQIEGVAEVTVTGGRQRVLEVEVDERKALALRISPAFISNRIRELDIVRSAGVVHEGGLQRSLTIRLRPDTVTDLLGLVLLANGDRIVRLADVATVRDTWAEPTSLYRIDGFPAINFTIKRAHGTNSLVVADAAKTAVDSVGRSLAPGTRIILDNDVSRDIRAQFSDLRTRAAIAAMVIFAVLLLFLGSFRSAGIVFTTIAFSLMIALNFVYFGGYSLNVLTLMGMAMGFGLIVDNAIVVLENVYRRRQSGESAEVAAEQGARDVVLAILVATMTTIVVFIPFVYLQGELRLYYLPLAIVVGLSLLASLLVSFSFIPALAARLFAGGVGRRSADAGAGGGVPALPRQAFYVRAYAGMLRGTLRFPWVVLLLAASMFYGSWRLFDKYVSRGRLWSGFGAQATYIHISINLTSGEGLDRADDLARFFEEKLKAMPELERFRTTVRPSNAQIRITFPDSLENTMVPLAIYDHLAAYSYQFGGTDVRVTGVGRAFYGGGGSPPNYSVKILGYNYETVHEIAEGLADRLTRFTRIRDVDINSSGRYFSRNKATEVVLRIDRERLGMHELTVQDLVRQVAAATRGQSGGSVPTRIGGDELRLDVKYAGFERLDMIELENVLIPVPRGGAVRLGEVARVDERFLPAQITREDQQYQRIVSYEFRGPVRLGDRIRDAVIAATAVPEGYTIVGREDFQWSREDTRQLKLVVGVSLLLIFMVCAALFESLRQPLCVLLTVPMALIGVFMLFFYTGASFTREAYIGVIMMGGIVVNASILLIDRVNQLRRDHAMPLVEAIIDGTVQRVRPILMTSTSTVLGLLPLVLFSEYADKNIWNALAYALIGGLTSSTILVLTVTPSLYLILERRKERRRLAALERRRGEFLSSPAGAPGQPLPSPAPG
ncbi:MAG TPA: efflux RND transporter permease subunit [Gemmatimonadaceae bacterium]|nr:efflux RND transporter permease subunit [Gemmatimonadaceae bacterium]